MKTQVLDRTPIYQMLFDDYWHILQSKMRVPDAFRIDDHHRTVSALIETTAIIDPDPTFQAG
jgi:hypothetical protein